MNFLSVRRLFLIVIAVTLLDSGCRRSKAAVTTPTPVDIPSSPATRPDDDSDAARRRAEEERLRIEREAAERARAAAEATVRAPVFFAYDQSELDEVARGLLDAKLSVLRTHGTLRIRVEGHTDERGSDEYNLALGFRRGTAGKRYLTDRGIGDSRVEVTSLGEEQPTCTEAGESCWQRNRRAEFSIIGGTIGTTNTP